MTAEHLDRSGRVVQLAAVGDDNWRDVADVAPTDDQRRFVAALGARYLLLSMRTGLWTSLAVLADGEVVGHVMWAYEPAGGSHWIGGMLIGAAEQGKGVGRAALLAAIAHLGTLPDAQEIRLAYHPEDTVAAACMNRSALKTPGIGRARMWSAPCLS